MVRRPPTLFVSPLSRVGYPTMKCRSSYLRYVAIVALGVACHGDRSYSAGPTALFLDANHDGNVFFVWLPPMLNQGAPAGQVFSRQLSPIVTITNLCNGEIIRTLAGSDLAVWRRPGRRGLPGWASGEARRRGRCRREWRGGSAQGGRAKSCGRRNRRPQGRRWEC